MKMFLITLAMFICTLFVCTDSLAATHSLGEFSCENPGGGAIALPCGSVSKIEDTGLGYANDKLGCGYKNRNRTCTATIGDLYLITFKVYDSEICDETIYYWHGVVVGINSNDYDNLIWSAVAADLAVCNNPGGNCGGNGGFNR